MIRNSSEPGYLAGQFLAAMPTMGDPRFDKSVIYICAHSEEGAMGIVVNQPLEELSFPDILEQMGIEPTPTCDSITVHCGGPVEAARGFVLHSSDYQMDGTLVVDDTVALRATTEILKAIAYGTGPKQSLMALGYAGWGAGQLDEEIKSNAWLNIPSDAALLWATEDDAKWDTALKNLGISPAMLVGEAGHA